MLVHTLIDKAAANTGTRYKLAKLLGVTPAQVYDWEQGRKKCSPPDRARLAAIAGENAQDELVAATLEATAGTLRGEQLKQALGKSALGVGGATALMLCGSDVMAANLPGILRCILC